MKHPLSILLVLLLTALPLTACHSTDNPPLNAPTELPEKTSTLLTNVFTETPFSLPQSEEMLFCEDSVPYRDSAAGTYTFLAQSADRRNPAYFLLTYDQSGTLVTEAPLPADLTGLQESAVTADGLVCRVTELDMETYRESSTLLRVNADGTTSESEHLAVLLGLDSDAIFPDALAADAESRTYFVYSGEIFVLDGAFQVQYSLVCDAENVTVLEDRVYAGMTDGIALIDPAAASLGEKIPLPAGIVADECFAADGFALCYRTSEGIFGVSEDGTAELLLSFQNSNLIGADVDVLYALDRDTFLLSDSGTAGLWHRAADIDLSDAIVLDVAYTYMNDSIPEFLRKVMAFNQSQSAIRVVTKDYQVHLGGGRTGLNQESTLVMDLLTGVYLPDVVVTNTQYAAELSKIYENGLYTDLYPLLDADETLSRDDFFGCVTRTFEDADGKLGAICGTFRVDTLTGEAERLAWNDCWTLSEMLGLFRSLGADETIMVGLGANNAAKNLLGPSGYAMFLDRETGTCSFDSADFIAYLEFLKTLPEKFNYDAYGTTAPRILNEQLNPVVRQTDYADLSQWMNDKFLFEGRAVSRIGYASADGERNGSYIVTTPYLITSCCDDTEAAWTFIKEILFSEDSGEAWMPLGKDFTARKSDFAKVTEAAKEYVFAERRVRKYDPENPPTEADGPYAMFTDEDAGELFAWLDGDVGVPYAGFADAAVTEIVNEEISAYLGGAQTAEKCADIIQSRVSLWLSEHD